VLGPLHHSTLHVELNVLAPFRSVFGREILRMLAFQGGDGHRLEELVPYRGLSLRVKFLVDGQRLQINFQTLMEMKYLGRRLARCLGQSSNKRSAFSTCHLLDPSGYYHA
jgi:hypothetical protein